MKINEILSKWANKVDQLWANGYYLRSIMAFLLPPVLVALLVVLIVKVITACFNFLCRNYDVLIIAGIAICLFIAWLDKRKTDKIEREKEEQEIRERRSYSDRLEAAQTRDATYTAQGKIIFSVARELGPLGIVPPATPSNIYSPGRTILKAKGTVALSLYLLQKDCETVDTDLLKHTLQTKIDQRLQDGEFPGIPEQHIYQGRVYSGFVIDMVRDSTGGFVEVYTALVDDSYCCYRENRELNRYRLLSTVDRRDMDY